MNHKSRNLAGRRRVQWSVVDHSKGVHSVVSDAGHKMGPISYKHIAIELAEVLNKDSDSKE